MSKQRNPVIRHANILRKGGAHQKSKTGQRHHHKQAIGDEAEAFFQHRQLQRNGQRNGAEDDCPRSKLPLFPPYSLSNAA